MSSSYQTNGHPSDQSNQGHLYVVSTRTRYERLVKPVIDRLVGLILLILLFPLMLIGAALVWLQLGRPVIYKQQRIGLNGKTFELYKLRTMRPDRRVTHLPYSGPERRRSHKTRRDPRIPSALAMLRKFRLDELPQFWNVVKGDMSLVGPRPELPEIVAGYEDWQHRRHEAKPGLTGPWQISDQNGHPMHECTELDIEYLRDVSLGTDLKILLQTPMAMFRRTGF